MDCFGISRIVIFSFLLFLMPNFDGITGNLPIKQPLRFLKPILYGRNILKRKTNEDYDVQVTSVELLPQLASSIVLSGSVGDGHSKNLPPNLLSALFTSDQQEIFGCTCADPNPLLGTVGRGCITTCLTSETLCYGQTCTRTTTFSALYSLLSVDQFIGGQIFPISRVTSTQFLQFFDKECELLESQCIFSSASTQAKVIGALGTGAAIALSVGIAKDMKTKPDEEQSEEEYKEYDEYFEEQKYSGRKSKSYFENLKSSMVPIDEQFDAMPRNLFGFSFRRPAQPAIGTCSCSVSIPLLFQQECTTTCLSSKRICGGHFCTQTSVFNAFLYPTGSNSELTTQTFLSVNNKDCEKLTADCIASSAIGAVAKIGAAAGLAAAALSSGMGAAAKLFITASNKSNGTANKEDERLHFNYTSRTVKKLKYFDSLLKSKSLFDEIEPFLESSIVEEKNLKRFHKNNLFSLFGGRQEVTSVTGCTCDDPSPSAGTIGRACSTTCRNSETLCSGSRTCYRTTTFMAVYSLITGRYYQAGDTGPLEATFSKKYFQIDETDCEILESQCSAASSLSKAIKSSGIFVVNVALTLGLAAGAVGIALMKAIHHGQSDVITYEEYKTPQYLFDSLRRAEMQFLRIKDVKFKLNRKETDHLPSVESSITEESKLKIPYSLFKFSAGRKGRAGSCSCDIIPGGPIECSTTCFSSEQPCGGSYCTRTSAFGACLYLGAYPPVVVATHSFLEVDNKDCDKLEIDCSVTSSVIAEAARVAAVAAGVGGVLSTRIAVVAVVVANNDQQNNNDNQNQQSNIISNQTPANNLPIPVVGLSFPDDGKW
jgi:hypothetical protein